LSIASHELKTPLTSLQLQIESLNRQLERRPAEALQEGRLLGGGRAVTAQTRRLADLVDVLLDVSRINSGKLRFEYSDLDLVELVREAVDRWRPSASAAESDLLLDLNGTNAVAGEWDRLRLEQILNNLLSNAVKYGAGKPIRIKVESEDGWARLAIADQGIGISPTDLARIFERFERAVPSRNYGGLGLGLWITHELVTGLGGTINVDSEPGRGSIFVVELPRHPVR
jgi:signal transduction histidine kinase